MLLRLSSKGQLVIPKPIRQSLKLKNGDQFHVSVVDGKILLEPIKGNLIHQMHGMFAGSTMLKELEEEHHQEVEND